MSRQREARLRRAAAELRRTSRDDEAAAIRAAIRDPAGAPTERAAAMGVRIRIVGYMMLRLDGLDEDAALEMLARDATVLSPLELGEARRGLRRHLADLGRNADRNAVSG